MSDILFLSLAIIMVIIASLIAINKINFNVVIISIIIAVLITIFEIGLNYNFFFFLGLFTIKFIYTFVIVGVCSIIYSFTKNALNKN